MTIQGALYELNQMMKNEDIPLYLIPTLKKVIETIVDEFNQKWIPVSERLPEEGETVLVCYQTQGGIAQSVCEWFDMPNRGIVWSTLGGRNPIAWQPLPEPYKEGGE